MSAPITLMVVDDHPSFRRGIRALIDSQPDMKLVAEAISGEQAVELFGRSRPDIVLMDLRMPGMGGVEAIMAIRKDFPNAKVIVITTYDWDEDIYRAVRFGAMSYILKDMSINEIVTTIRAVHRGEQKLPPQVAKLLETRLERKELTGRETEVLQMLAKGMSNKEIGVALCLSEATIKSHFVTLFKKLGVADRTQAVILAIRHGIIHLE